ncbi:hypothetical protein OKW28_000462 [Paraburkholderia sp. 40]
MVDNPGSPAPTPDMSTASPEMAPTDAARSTGRTRRLRGRAYRPSCQRRSGWDRPGSIIHTPVGLKSHDPSKLDGVLICAVAKPFDAGSWAPVPALAV